MSAPPELSLAEIRQYMLTNGCKVTNHALVKHFKRFLTHPDTQNEARKQFKTYVNILSTIKNENNQKFLILRKKYLHECPSEEMAQQVLQNADTTLNSPSDNSIATSESSFAANTALPFRQPPPYKPPPTVGQSDSASVISKSAAPTSTTADKKTAPIIACVGVAEEHVDKYRECVNEFAAETATRNLVAKSEDEEEAGAAASKEAESSSISRTNSFENNKENIARFSFSSGASGTSSSSADSKETDDNRMTVKEATRKFNRMASQEDGKVLTPPTKKKPEKDVYDVKDEPEVGLNHPKAKEWIVAMAKANYQELNKLANEYSELIKLQDPSTGYTALHWAAKHGNVDVVKLIAGTFKADVNSRTYGGYTPLHLAMQFGRVNIFELLCNVYKANRDVFDWSGNKALDYSKQRTTVSPSTYSSEYIRYCSDIDVNEMHQVDIDIGRLTLANRNVGNAGDGIGGTLGSAFIRGKRRPQLSTNGTTTVSRTQSLLTTMARKPRKATIASSAAPL